MRERIGERMLPWTEGTARVRAHAPESTFKGIFAGLFRVLFLPMSLVLFRCEFLMRMRDGIAFAVVPVFAVQKLGFSSADYSTFQGYVGFSIAAAGVLLGPLMDRFGVKRLYLIAVGISAATTILFAAAPAWWPNLTYVIATRHRQRPVRPVVFRRLHRARDESVLAAGRGKPVRHLYVVGEFESVRSARWAFRTLPLGSTTPLRSR